MNSRKEFIRRVAEFRWWGCVLLAMFVVVQTARGTDLSSTARLTAPLPSDRTLPFVSDPLQAPIVFGSARPLDVARTAPAAPNNALTGDPQIQTP